MHSQVTFRFSFAKQGLTALALCAGMLQFSCSPKLLDESFSQDTPGQLPKKNIPGDPSGDSIQYIPQIENRLKVVPYVAGSQDKALSFSNQPIFSSTHVSGHNKWLVFRGTQTGDFSKIINYLVFGKFDNFMAPLFIDLADGAGTTFARLQVDQGGMLYAINDYSKPDDRTPICQLKANLIYTVSFQINMKTAPKGTCRIGFIGDVVVNGQSESGFSKTIPLMFNPINDVKGPIHPSIHFDWADENANGQSQFTITGLAIKLG